MGLYMYVNEQDRITKRRVSDEYINEEFQEALKYDPSLMIEENLNFKPVKVGWFRTKMVADPRYSIYHETPASDGSPYMARLQASGSGERKVVIAYLHGIINGINHKMNEVNA